MDRPGPGRRRPAPRGLQIKAVPFTLVLRADGTARSASIGRQSYDALVAALK
ncbi:MAG: hypothetical protein IPL61_11350 [Myxococcales bacterium]|nr:hypothetical protein [Myxococcales bacterium]